MSQIISGITIISIITYTKKNTDFTPEESEFAETLFAKPEFTEVEFGEAEFNGILILPVSISDIIFFTKRKKIEVLCI